jgi:putative peptidoglycan lipid II flippase
MTASTAEQDGISHESFDEGKRVVKDSVVISAFNSLGVVSAVLVDVLVAARYGMGAQTDAFFIALTVPQLMVTVLASTTRQVLVPLFSITRVEGGEEENWKVFSNLINLSIILLTLVALAGAVCSPVLMIISAPGIAGTSRRLAVDLNRVLFAFVIAAGLAEIMKAMLNSYRRFALPATTTFIQYMGVAVGIVLLDSTFGIQAVAVGYVLGSGLQVGILIVALLVLGWRYHPSLDIRHPTVRQASRLFAPLFVGEISGQANIWGERFLASFLPMGSVSALVYARRVLRALTQALVNSVSNALLPRLSVLVSQGKIEELRRTLVFGLKLTLVVCVPVAAGVMVTSRSLIGLLFQRGAFDEKAVSLAASVLVLYMPGLALMALWQLGLAPFYAFRDARTALQIRMASLAFLLLCQVVLFWLAGVHGLAAAISLSRVGSVIGTHLLLRRKIGDLEERLWPYTLKVGVAAIAMGIVVALVVSWMQTQLAIGLFSERILELGTAALLGLATYVAMLVILRVGEVSEGIRLVGTRLISNLANAASPNGS